MKQILLLITIIVLGMRSARSQTDSLILSLKTEHDKNCCVAHKKERQGTTNGKLLVLTKKGTSKMDFDSTKNELRSDCLGDVDFALCKQVYRLYSTDPNDVMMYETFKCSNRLSLIIDDILYSTGETSFESTFNPNLIDGLSSRYEYKDGKKFLTLNVAKNIRLELDPNGHRIHTIMDAEHLSFKQAKKRYGRVTILAGSSIKVCVRD